MNDPQGCARSYNRAVQRHPEAGIPPLFAMAREYRWELPFWLLDQDRGRRALYSEMVERPGFDRDRLATRAMSLTASVRLSLCDLFIHGTGGAVYDRATDDWLQEWLGERLAPSVAITADVRRSLPIDAPREASEDDLARALWLVHSARHNPELIGDDRAAREKRATLAELEQQARGSRSRLDLYRAMHRSLRTVRERHREELGRLDRRAAMLQRGVTVRELEAKRDWPSVLYPPEQLDALASTVEKMLAGSGPISL